LGGVGEGGGVGVGVGVGVVVVEVTSFEKLLSIPEALYALAAK